MNISRRGLLAAGGAAVAAIGVSRSTMAGQALNQDRLLTSHKKGRRLSQAVLDQTVADHAAWLDDPTTGQPADLSKTDLSGLTLTKVSLEGADLSGARLRGLSFYEVDLRWANFSDSELSLSSFVMCNLSGANFNRARLNQARLINMRGDQAAGSDQLTFRQADLTGARVLGVFEEGNFNAANLVGADLSHSGFNFCDFTGADLTGANLESFTAFETNFTLSVFRYANLDGAILQSNNLTGADLTGLKMTGAYLDCNRLGAVKLADADLRCSKFKKNFGCQGLMHQLTKPGQLGCRLAGAIIGDRSFPWPGGQMPNRVWINHQA